MEILVKTELTYGNRYSQVNRLGSALLSRDMPSLKNDLVFSKSHLYQVKHCELPATEQNPKLSVLGSLVLHSREARALPLCRMLPLDLYLQGSLPAAAASLRLHLLSINLVKLMMLPALASSAPGTLHCLVAFFSMESGPGFLLVTTQSNSPLRKKMKIKMNSGPAKAVCENDSRLGSCN